MPRRDVSPPLWAVITRLVGAILAASAGIILIVIGAVVGIDYLMDKV